MAHGQRVIRIFFWKEWLKSQGLKYSLKQYSKYFNPPPKNCIVCEAEVNMDKQYTELGLEVGCG